MMNFDRLVQGLQDPSAYPDRPTQVQVVQTHISVLFLTGAYVYKVKKPVDFGFLDFQTLEKRRYYCEQEVALNRRLSPHVYLGVVPITEDSGQFHVEGRGEPVEFAVKMVQLPQEGMMDHLLAIGGVTEVMVRHLAEEIAHSHDLAETDARIAEIGGLDAVRRNVDENLQQVQPYLERLLDQDQFDRIRQYSHAFLDRRASLFHQRAQEGRVRDGHGDLRAAQVCFHNARLSILDCIEFNDRFRYGDVASDIAFLAMDLDYHGRPDLTRVLMQAYLAEGQDWAIQELLPFYQCYRACIRGKVEGLTLDDRHTPPSERERIVVRGRRYFALAAQYTQRPAGPILILVGGLMGTGKTTLAHALVQERGPAHLSSDVTRKRLAGLDPQTRRHVPFDTDIYSPDFTRRTYQALLHEARDLLTLGRSVIVDASFRDTVERHAFQDLARDLHVPLLFLLCAADDATIQERLGLRLQDPTSVSDGRWEIYHTQKERFEPPMEILPDCLVTIDTTDPLADLLPHLLARVDYPVQWTP